MIDLSDDKARLDVARIHGWLASSYWSPGIDRALVERAIAGSHCLGAYRGRRAGRLRAGDHRSCDLRVDRRRLGRRGGARAGARAADGRLVPRASRLRGHPPDRAGHARRARRLCGARLPPADPAANATWSGCRRGGGGVAGGAVTAAPDLAVIADHVACGQPRARYRLRRRRADGGAARHEGGRCARAGDRCGQRRRRGGARAVGDPGRCRCRSRRLSRRQLRLRDPQPDVADRARARRRARSSAADRRRALRQLSQFRALAGAAVAAVGRADAGDAAVARALVRHAQHPPRHDRRFPRAS